MSAEAIGIFYPPTALFVVAFGFVLLLLLHFSSAVSRLSDQTKVLAQRLALLEERVRHHEEPGANEDETDARLVVGSESEPRRFAGVRSER